MKLYAHFDEREPAHTEVLEFDGSSDIPFELVRALFVDAYNAKHAPARLDPQALLPTDELGVARHPLGGSIFDALNEGDDLFFASGAGGTVASLKEEIQAGGAAPQPLAEQIAELKEQIKRATDEGQYDLLAPLAQQIKALEEEQQAKAAVPLPAPAVVPYALDTLFSTPPPAFLSLYMALPAPRGASLAVPAALAAACAAWASLICS